MDEQKHEPETSPPANELSPPEKEPSPQVPVSPYITKLKAEPKREPEPPKGVLEPQQTASPYLAPREARRSRVAVTKRRGKKTVGAGIIIFIATIIVSFVLITGFSFIMQKFSRGNALQFTLQYSDGAVNSKKPDTIEWKPLESYGVVDSGDQVDSWTSTRVILSLDENNSIRLGENTKIELVKVEKTDSGYNGKIKILQGRIWLQGNEKSFWNVDTPAVSVDFHGKSAEVSLEEDGSVKLKAWKGELAFAIKGSSAGNIELAEGEETNYSTNRTLTEPRIFDRDSPDEWEAWNTQHKETEKVSKGSKNPAGGTKTPELSFAGKTPAGGGSTKTSSEIIKQPGINKQTANTGKTAYNSGTARQTQPYLPSDLRQPPATAPPGGPALPGRKEPEGVAPPEEPDDNPGQAGKPDYRLPEDIQTSAPGYNSSEQIRQHAPGWGGEDQDKFIKNDNDAKPYINEARQILASNFGMFVNTPIDFHVASVSEIDKFVNDDPTKPFIRTWGVETTRNGRHIILFKEGLTAEYFLTVVCHETTHAWQNEMCPQGRSMQITEGFATWIEYKVAGIKGYRGVQIANKFYCEPQYSGSLKKLLIIEKKIGERKLIELIQRSRTISELKKLAGM